MLFYSSAFTVEKTKVTVIMRIKGSPECNIKVNGTTLKTVNEFKYVGDLDKIREIYSLSQRRIPQNDISAFLLVQNPIYTLPWIVFLMFIFTFIVYCFKNLCQRHIQCKGKKREKQQILTLRVCFSVLKSWKERLA